MSPWKMVAAVAVAAVGLSLGATPAAAEEGLGVGTEFAGAVVSTSATLGPSSVGTEEVTGICAYIGHPSVLSGKMNYVFAGVAVAHSTSTKQPQYAVITCELESPRSGPQDPYPAYTTGPVGLACGAPICTLTGTNQWELWPQRQVRICISGSAIFGPSNPIQVDIPRTCS